MVPVRLKGPGTFCFFPVRVAVFQEQIGSMEADTQWPPIAAPDAYHRSHLTYQVKS